LPVAALAQWLEGTMSLDGLIASPDGGQVLRDRQTTELDSIEAAANFGQSLAGDLLGRGGEKLIPIC
jgi:Porphobilinogen deaminase, C-terminal domain.